MPPGRQSADDQQNNNDKKKFRHFWYSLFFENILGASSVDQQLALDMPGATGTLKRGIADQLSDGFLDRADHRSAGADNSVPVHIIWFFIIVMLAGFAGSGEDKVGRTGACPK